MRQSLDLEIAAHELEIKQLRLMKRQVNLVQRLDDLPKGHPDYDVEVARLNRNIQGLELRITSIEVHLAQNRADKKVVDEEIDDETKPKVFSFVMPMPSTPADLSELFRKSSQFNPSMEHDRAGFFDGFAVEDPFFGSRFGGRG